MRNIRVSAAYDGTDFVGWQEQGQGRSVQGVLEAALQKIHKHEITIYGAGRTDSGVHAAGQVFNFYSDLTSIPGDKYVLAINQLLPPDVRILSSRDTYEGFNARKDARIREYRYYLYPGKIMMPYLCRYAWRVDSFDINLMNQMAQYVVGTHDFTSFTAVGDTNPAKVKEIYSAGFYIESPFIVFRITGSAFLWRMVRNIVGTILRLVYLKEQPVVFQDILARRNSQHAGMTAPAQGLFLYRVMYEDDAANIY